MYVDAQTIITAAAFVGAVSALLGALFAVYRWYQRQNKQDEDIKAMKEEMCLLTYGVLACSHTLLCRLLPRLSSPQYSRGFPD